MTFTIIFAAWLLKWRDVEWEIIALTVVAIWDMVFLFHCGVLS